MVHHQVSVTISNVHLVGSPMELELTPGPPDVDKCVASGEGLTSAQAGRPAIVSLYCKDAYNNLANRSSAISFGLVLLPRDSKDVIVKKETNEVLMKSAEAPGGTLLDSMPFEGGWVDEQFEIRYKAENAGEFGLHIWTNIENGKRKFIPDSPFAVRVSGVRAAAAGSFLVGAEEYAREIGPEEEVPYPDVGASLMAGERLQLYPRLRDEFGNASFATEGALVASIDTPTEHSELPIKQLKELGKYEMSYETQKKGLHTVNIQLDGAPIGGSPFRFVVVPAAPLASKCRLIPPEENPLVHTNCELRLEAYDRYGNRLETGGATIMARVVGTGVSQVTVIDHGDGSYSLEFSGAVAGDCRVVVRLDNTEMNPCTVTFVKGAEEEPKP